MMNKIMKCTIFAAILLVAILPVVSGEYWEEREEMVKFLATDKTDMDARETVRLSSTSAYYLAKSANESGFRFGTAKFYNPYEKVGYVFCYTITSDGYFVFIDPETDAIYTYNEAKHRLSSGMEIPYVRYHYFYPFVYRSGSGPAPAWMSRVK